MLDLRQNNLRTRDVTPLVPMLTNNKMIRVLDISTAIISKKNMQLLWLALHVNVGVIDLIYSRINFLALDEIRTIDSELFLNRMIDEEVRPNIERITHTKSEISLKGFQIPRRTSPAVIKYIKTIETMRSLDLSDTGLRRSDINHFISEISMRQIKLTALNLS